MPSINETRLNAYLAAEASILQFQESRGSDRTLRQAELAEVRKGIEQLQILVAREKQADRGGPRYAVVDLSGDCE